MDLLFGEFLLVRHEKRLRGPQGDVALGQRSCDILVTLLASSGQVVTKQDLMDAVWPGVVVEENTLQAHVSALRKALGPSLIQTVQGRGYKYVGPEPRSVEDHSSRGGFKLYGHPYWPGVAAESDLKTTSVAVLPFSAEPNSSDQQLLADGLVEDLITELARYRHLTVIGRRLSSQYSDAGAAPGEISRDHGVEFVISGSVRVGSGVIRVVVQLIDTETSAVAWGDRFDRELGDLFEVQDAIVGAVVARLAFNLDAAAEKRQQRNPTLSGSAYMQFLHARSLWRNGPPERALSYALKAIDIDPDYSRARAYAAYFYAYARFGQWHNMTLAELDTNAARQIERALAIDPTDPFVLQRASMTYLMLGNPEAALQFAEKAALVSAIDSEILVIHGFSLACSGRKDEGAQMLEKAIALEPRVPEGCYSALAEVLHMQRDYRASQAVLDKIPNPPDYVMLLKAANLARLGNSEASRSLVDGLPANFDCGLFARCEAKMCALNEDAEHWLESFRQAGVRV